MGRRYYCDYCDKTMSCAPSIIKTHNNGILHHRAKQDHYQQFKDPETILAEETRKKPCVRFPYGNCQFGSICRFSHYSPEAIQTLKNYVSTKRLADNMTSQPCFRDLYNKLQMERATPRDGHTIKIDDGHTITMDDNGVTHKLPWSYNTILDDFGANLPPSVKRIRIEDFNNVSFAEWG